MKTHKLLAKTHKCFGFLSKLKGKKVRWLVIALAVVLANAFLLSIAIDTSEINNHVQRG